jgi:hypothetical protein
VHYKADYVAVKTVGATAVNVTGKITPPEIVLSHTSGKVK